MVHGASLTLAGYELWRDQRWRCMRAWRLPAALLSHHVNISGGRTQRTSSGCAVESCVGPPRAITQIMGALHSSALLQSAQLHSLLLHKRGAKLARQTCYSECGKTFCTTAGN